MVESDCVHAGEVNEAGQVWCKKKNIYVSPERQEGCPDYEKKG